MLRRILFPPAWLAALIAIPSFVWVGWQLGTGQTECWQAYASYALSAYGLVLVCVRIPGVVRAVRTGFDRHPLVRRLLGLGFVKRLRTDPVFGAQMGLYFSLALSLFHAFVHLIAGWTQRSLWFGALAGYYLLLTLMRALLSVYAWRRKTGRHPLQEWRRYRLVGVVLLMMNQALSVVTALVVYRGEGFSYPGYTIYVMALYAFYAVFHALISMNRLRRRHSPVLLASGMITLVTALVSILSLETAMLAQFGSSAVFRTRMTAATGGAVCTLVLGAAIYMIVRAQREIKNALQGESK